MCDAEVNDTTVPSTPECGDEAAEPTHHKKASSPVQKREVNEFQERLPDEKKINRKDLEFRHAVLVHRYDYEVGRMNNLKSQSTFIMGAVGLVITLGLTLCTADRFSLAYIDGWVAAIVGIGGGFLLAAAFSSMRVFWRVHGWGYCLAYPSDKHIFGSPVVKQANSPDDLNPALVKIIERNSKKNDYSVDIMRISLGVFVIGIGIALIIGFFLLCICLAQNPSDAILSAANVTIVVSNASIPN